MNLVLSRNIERIEKEGVKLGIKTEVIRKLLLEYWRKFDNDPEKFAELIEKTLC
ncbi:MAG: hypothetical protein J7K95_03220 [Thermoplasmata archaeon]|nr:hypothetical protein [Thermoplasmata archaeon]